MTIKKPNKKQRENIKKIFDTIIKVYTLFLFTGFMIANSLIFAIFTYVAILGERILSPLLALVAGGNVALCVLHFNSTLNKGKNKK